ncbi:hypothetical protein SO694_00123025 [Aureococcus anophagefferens]|uniref:DUF4116 domain-containing protein n=1 Tax=Aureococcus anophagefferens TaxID=44056 RepID=A0ABR1FIT5_AURAN
MVILSSDERFADPPLSATAYSWRQDDSWKTDKHLCLEKVKENGLYLATAAEEMRSNRRIVLAAVKSDGHALNVASEALKNDEEIVFAAIEQDGDSLSFAGDTLEPQGPVQRDRLRPWKDKYKPQVKGRRHLKNNFEDGLEEEETNGFGGDE